MTALMEAYTTDAGILRLVAIDAIKKRAIAAGVGQADSTDAQKAAYVPVWIWNHVTERLKALPGRSKGVGRSIAISQSKHTCGQTVFTNATFTRLAVDQPPRQARRSRNRTLQSGRSRGPTTTGAKKGFEAFSITTQQMILFGSERDKTGSARSALVDTYREIIGSTKAAFVAQHLHHHLKTRLGLNVLLPSSFCSTVRMASFISRTNNRPEAFSLFSCSPQPLDKKALTDLTGNVELADDLMRMQLKVADSTTGLSDKDIKKLPLVRHVVPHSFRALAELFT